MKIDLQEVGIGGMTWIYLAQDRSGRMIAVMNLMVPYAGKFLDWPRLW